MSCGNCLQNVTPADSYTNYFSVNERLSSHNYLNDEEPVSDGISIIEVRFKGTRKSLFQNRGQLNLHQGDKVAVEALSGHDIGEVSLTGRLAEFQFKRKSKQQDISDLPVVYRMATQQDMERWSEAKSREQPTMLQTRKIVQTLGLEMKISDVEFQGDGKKAVFYYIAEGRVDFRVLIKKLAEAFRIKVEMRQIGVRQEAGHIGGIGSCGRQLCCSTWKTNFQAIPLATAKYQDLSANAQKLAGQCGKLKCCLMYEIDHYLEAWDDFPKELLDIQTKKGVARPVKTDVLSKKIFYAYEANGLGKFIGLTIDQAKDMIQQNKRGIIPDDLMPVTQKETDDWGSDEMKSSINLEPKESRQKTKSRKNS